MSRSHAGSCGFTWNRLSVFRYSPTGTAGGMPPAWSMTPTRGPSLTASLTGARPSTRTGPPSALRYPSQTSMVVVLPAPFGPRIAVTSPRRAVRLSPSTAVAGPYRLTMPKSSTAGLGSARGETGGALLTDAVYGSVPGDRTARVRQSVVDLTKALPGISVLPGHMDVALVPL